MPTYWQSVDNGATLTPAILLLLLVACIGFIVMAERKREMGLPRFEGSWSKDESIIEYRIISGFSLEIGEMTMGEGWRANGKIKKQTISKNTTYDWNDTSTYIKHPPFFDTQNKFELKDKETEGLDLSSKL